ncbi:MAG TPA: hypothetical protein VF883_02025 [Thermoanaerobaculia bacterium]
MRGLAAVAMMVVLGSGVSAEPRNPRGPREKGNPIVKVVKKVIKSLGDGLTVPLP